MLLHVGTGQVPVNAVAGPAVVGCGGKRMQACLACICAEPCQVPEAETTMLQGFVTHAGLEASPV
jgi:hypothetical protein